MSTQENLVRLHVADVWMDGPIVVIKFKCTETHTLEDAQQVVSAHNAMSEGRPRPVLVDLRQVNVGANKQARNHYASLEAGQYKSAMAMVTNSALRRTIGALFLFLSRPSYPGKMFSSETQARMWLESYLPVS
jgi:hypothetical protein